MVFKTILIITTYTLKVTMALRFVEYRAQLCINCIMLYAATGTVSLLVCPPICRLQFTALSLQQ